MQILIWVFAEKKKKRQELKLKLEGIFFFLISGSNGVTKWAAQSNAQEKDDQTVNRKKRGHAITFCS